MTVTPHEIGSLTRIHPLGRVSNPPAHLTFDLRPTKIHGALFDAGRTRAIDIASAPKRRKISLSPYRSAAAPATAGPATLPIPNRSRVALKPVEGRSRKTSELHTESSALINIVPDPKRIADAATAGNDPGARPRSPAARP